MKFFFPLCAFFVFFSGLEASDKPIFQTDFNQADSIKGFRKNGSGITHDRGVLDINRKNGGFSSAVLPVSNQNPCRISFRIREVEKGAKKESHWGVTIDGGERQSVQFYSRGKGVEVLRKRNGNVISVRSISASPKFPQAHGAAWTDLSLVVLKNRIDVFAGKSMLGSTEANLLPMREISLYAYNNHVQFDDLKILPIHLNPDAGKKSAALVFHAPFDGTADANGKNGQKILPERNAYLRYENGLSGKAVVLEKRKQSKTPLRIDASWTTENGQLVNRHPNGVPQVRLSVPDLNAITLSFAFRREKISPKDNHFGIFIHGTKGNSIRFFTHANVWTYILTENGKQKTFKDFSKELPIPPAASDSDRTKASFSLENGVFTACIGEKKLQIPGVGFQPVKEVSIYTYGAAATVDDLKVSGGSFLFEENFDRLSLKGGDGELSYCPDGIFGKSGAVMFWFRPGWDAKENTVTYPLFRAYGTDRKAKINLFLWTWLRCDIGLKDNMNPVSINRFGRKTWFKGDWRHLVVTWNADDDGRILFYLDALPYLPTNNWAGNGKALSNADIESAVRFVMDHSAEGAFDELKIYQGSVSPKIVWDEYRRYMPIDLVMQRAVLDPSREDEVAVQLAPGGFYMRPMPVPEPEIQADVRLKLELLSADGTVLKSGEEQTLHVDKPMEVRLPVGRLNPSMDYRVRCRLHTGRGEFQRTFHLRAAEPRKAGKESDSDLQIGKKIFSKKLRTVPDSGLISAGTLHSGTNYLEAGPNKGNRFAFAIPIPENLRAKGCPVLLEIIWPDDKPRMMGLYMYKKTKSRQHRDRLQGGIQSGNEYPVSGEMVKTHYLFYPGTDHYLFEARTMANGYPAAVSEVNMYEIKGELPNLKLNLPKSSPGRTFGMMDEDQTIETNLDFDNPDVTSNRMRSILLTDLMLNYFDYTGQNVLQSPMLRYGWANYQTEGNPGSGMYPGNPGELPYMVEAFGKRGKKIVGILNFTNLPEAAFDQWVDSTLEKEGVYLRNSDGEFVPSFAAGKTVNVAHPLVRRLYYRHVEELLKLFSKSPNVDGFEVWTGSFGTWKNLKNGYDDYSVNQFSKDTGIKVPETGRYEFLTGPKRREWIDWRARQITGFYRGLRETMNRYNPKQKLYLAIGDGGLNADGVSGKIADQVRESTGIDFEELKKIPGVFPIPMRFNTSYRWAFHWGKPETNIDEILYERNKAHYQKNQSTEMSVIYPAYFETFESSPDNRNYASYFQNADVKPHGRFFLKELTANVALFDSRHIAIGAQPLGTWGRDAEAREFARAYRALPDKPFIPVPGANDPVSVRYLNTPEGTYFYLASMLYSDCRVKINFSEPRSFRDLSSGTMMDSDTVTLLPYQLRSFLIPERNVRILSIRISVPEKTKRFYLGKKEERKRALDLLASQNVPVSEEKSLFEKMETAFANGEYAEMHRLLFSRTMNQMLLKVKNLESVIRQEKMIRNGHFAINCGDSSFYAAPNGQFFFPDRPYSDSARYGYFGKYNSVGRSIEKLDRSNLPLLYRSEAYDIDGYQFKLPDGLYRVRLYMKVGWPKDFQKGRVRLSVFAQGKPLFEAKDLFDAQNGDFWKPYLFESAPIPVKNGILELKFETGKGVPSNCRLCNAIEIIKIKK